MELGVTGQGPGVQMDDRFFDLNGKSQSNSWMMTGGTPHDETETTQWAICPKIHGTSDWDHDCLDLAHGLMRSYASWIRVWAFTPPKLHVFKSYCSHL